MFFKSEKEIKKNTKSGFTVLESLVAILVVSVAVTAAFASVQNSLNSAMYARDEVKAFFLAQEAIEAVRNKRDKNQIDNIASGSVNWLTGIASQASDPCYFGKTCTVDTTNNPFIFTACGSGNPSAWDSCANSGIRYNPSTFVQGHNLAWTLTNFKREMQLEVISNDSLGNPAQISVTVQVTWTKGVKVFKFKAKTILFNLS